MMPTFLALSTSADLEAFGAQRHFHETGIGIGTVLKERLLDAGCGLWVFSHHIEIAASTSTSQFVAQAEIIYLAGDGFHLRGDWYRCR